MKVIVANNYHYLRGGSERVMFDEMRLLVSRGITAIPFSRQHPDNEPSSHSQWFPPDMNLASGGVAARLRALPKLVYARDAKRGMTQLVRELRPDLVHAHNVYGRLSTSILDAAYREGVPVVMTLHDYKLICPSYKLESHGRICEKCRGFRFHRAVTERCHKGSLVASAIYSAESVFNHVRGAYARRVARLIAPSRFLRDKFVQFGWDGAHIDVVPNFLDADRFEPDFGRGDYFLYLGRLSPEKGVPTLLEAFSRVQRPARLVVAGTGPLLAELAAKWSDEAGVTFAGYLSGERLAKCVRGALAVVVPSEWYENAPMAVLEAMAWGKPVIAAAIGGMPEMVRDGETGLLFEPGNVDGLHKVMTRVLSLAPSAVSCMGRAARAVAQEEFSAARHYNALVSVYKRATARS
jgi:glycosyltransferase involved in cell wall biosynthesis